MTLLRFTQLLWTGRRLTILNDSAVTYGKRRELHLLRRQIEHKSRWLAIYQLTDADNYSNRPRVAADKARLIHRNTFPNNSRDNHFCYCKV